MFNHYSIIIIYIVIGITPVHHITSCLWHQVWWISLYLLKHPGNPIPLPGLDLDGSKCPNAAVLSLISRNSILDCANHHSCQYTNRNRCWLPVCLTPANRGFFLQHQKQIGLYFLLSAKKQPLNASCFTIVTLPPRCVWIPYICLLKLWQHWSWQNLKLNLNSLNVADANIK